MSLSHWACLNLKKIPRWVGSCDTVVCGAKVVWQVSNLVAEALKKHNTKLTCSGYNILPIFLQSENGGERSEVGEAGGGAGEGEDEILAELQRKQAELKAAVSNHRDL